MTSRLSRALGVGQVLAEEMQVVLVSGWFVFMTPSLPQARRAPLSTGATPLGTGRETPVTPSPWASVLHSLPGVGSSQLRNPKGWRILGNAQPGRFPLALASFLQAQQSGSRTRASQEGLRSGAGSLRWAASTIAPSSPGAAPLGVPPPPPLPSCWNQPGGSG